MSVTNLQGRQGSVLHYQLSCYNPGEDGQPDEDSPFDLDGYSVRFSIQTPDTYVKDDPPEIYIEDNKVILHISAVVTAGWSAGKLPYEVELIPPAGESDAFALVYGTITLGKQSA